MDLDFKVSKQKQCDSVLTKSDRLYISENVKTVLDSIGDTFPIANYEVYFQLHILKINFDNGAEYQFEVTKDEHNFYLEGFVFDAKNLLILLARPVLER